MPLVVGAGTPPSTGTGTSTGDVGLKAANGASGNGHGLVGLGMLLGTGISVGLDGDGMTVGTGNVGLGGSGASVGEGITVGLDGARLSDSGIEPRAVTSGQQCKLGSGRLSGSAGSPGCGMSI